MLFASMSRSCLSSFVFTPMPLHECIVIPPIWVAAIPVDAVTATGIFLLRKCDTSMFVVCVFPLPGSPVKKTWAPIFMIDNACSCVIGIYMMRV